MSSKVIMDAVCNTIVKYGEFLNNNMNKTKDKGYTWILCDTTDLILVQADIGMKVNVKIDGKDKEC